MNEHHKPRRAFLKLSGAALAAAPLLASSRWAAAEKNAAMRAALSRVNADVNLLRAKTHGLVMGR